MKIEYHLCDVCGMKIYKDQKVYYDQIEEQDLCEYCHDERYQRCDMCHKTFNVDTMKEIEDKRLVCSDCLSID